LWRPGLGQRLQGRLHDHRPRIQHRGQTGTSIAFGSVHDSVYDYMLACNSSDGLIYAWDYSVRVTYTPTIE
jgi:hypothetical protein